MSETERAEDIRITPSSGNVFRDIGFPPAEAEHLLIRSDLMIAIRSLIEERGLTQTRAARLLGVTHQGLAFILNGRHSDLLSIRTPVKRRRRSIIRYH